MKKTFFIITLIVLFNQMTIAQSLQFIYEGVELDNNQNVSVTQFMDDGFGGVKLKFAPTLKNNTSGKMTIKIIKEEIEMAEDSYSTFCTALGCFPGNESPINFDLEGNDETTSFYGEFFPFHLDSEAIIKYTAQQVGALQNSSATVEVHYIYSTTKVKDVGFTNLSIIQSGSLCHISYKNMNDIKMDIYTTNGVKLNSYEMAASNSSLEFHLPTKQGVVLLVFTDKQGNSTSEKILIK